MLFMKYFRIILIMSSSGALLGFYVGSVPTISMIVASALLSSINVSGKVEAAFQNFAAGLILAAVASELFPLMLDAPKAASYVGITIGFAVALLMLHGIEYAIEVIEKWSESFEHPDFASQHSSHSSSNKKKYQTLPEGLKLDDDDDYYDGEAGTGIAMTTSTMIGPISDLSTSPRSRGKSIKYHEFEDEPIHEASLAFASQPSHRHHIMEHMKEVADAIRVMEAKSNRLLEESNLSQREVEDIAEKIDEEIHLLQYKLDHCRRLIQGSETSTLSSSTTTNPMVQPTSWVTEERKVLIKQRLRNLNLIADHIIQHISIHDDDKHKHEKNGIIKLRQDDDDHHDHHDDTSSLLREIHAHMDQMEHQIEIFHHEVADVSSKWNHRSRPMVDVKPGDVLPIGLIIPVSLDCIVDGLMIGITCALSPSAGIILAAANCLEMGFLGMAYASRIMRCTGSKPSSRYLALYIPPMMMWISSVLGVLLGNVAYEVPTAYVMLVSFGTVVLLSLVCNELLIEAKQAQGDDEKWYIMIMIFAGVYIVLMMTRAGI